MIAPGRPVPVPSARPHTRRARRIARKQSELRRTAEHASAARVASGKDGSAGADPSHRTPASKPGASKPGDAQSPGSPDAGRRSPGPADGDVDAGDWTPRHAL